VNRGESVNCSGSGSGFGAVVVTRVRDSGSGSGFPSKKPEQLFVTGSPVPARRPGFIDKNNNLIGKIRTIILVLYAINAYI